MQSNRVRHGKGAEVGGKADAVSGEICGDVYTVLRCDIDISQYENKIVEGKTKLEN